MDETDSQHGDTGNHQPKGSPPAGTAPPNSYGSTGRTPPRNVHSPEYENPPPVELPDPALPFPSADGNADVRPASRSSLAQASPAASKAKSVVKKPMPFRSKTDVSATPGWSLFVFLTAYLRTKLTDSRPRPEHASPDSMYYTPHSSPANRGSPGNILAALRRRQTLRNSKCMTLFQ